MVDSLQQRSTVLNMLFQDYEGPAFSIRLWDGWQWPSSTRTEPVCTIVIETPGALEALIAEPNEITLGEAFIHRELDVEGDIFSVFRIAEHIINRPQQLRQQVWEKLAHAILTARRLLRHGSRHSRGRDKASISHHYDQPVEFFRPWLGETLAYSCAYFRNPEETLNVAQEQKIALICDKLRLRPSERLLDIGCGWGSLVLHAAGKRRACARGITLSREQAEVAKRRVERSRLGELCTVELRDYRELEIAEHSFDKIASVGMFEHVGAENLRQYFRIAHGLLKPGGVFLNHGIARSHSSPRRKNSFIDRYVFPDGELVTLSQALQAAEAERLEVRDVENLREHYELTLRRWVDGLQRNANAVLRHVSDVTYRVWLLYMAGSAAAFHRGDIAVYQVLLSRPDQGNSRMPLTREDWYLATMSEEEMPV
jgi:cyclopropane-fatty-acyl-phospholipid synthase